MTPKKMGEWLDINGRSNAFGDARLMVRVATGPTSWGWRGVTDDEKARLLNLWNANAQVPDAIELEIPSSIEAAVKRASMAIDSHYLPAQLNADLRTLMDAAMCWEIYEKQTRKPA